MNAHLAAATADLPTPLSPSALATMAQHWAMVKRWTQNVNMTSIEDDADAAWLHYRDALTALPFMTDGPTLDVGSGGGFPGIPLAIVRTQAPFVLMEPRRKRASLLVQAAAQLHLKHVDVYNGRLEDEATGAFAQVVTRATFSQMRILSHVHRWLRPEGRLLAFRSAASSLDEADLAYLAQAGLHYETGHRYTLRGHALRLDVWISRPVLRHNT
jgi:16S rRNA (guanine527-N7)-methyltransferase